MLYVTKQKKLDELMERRRSKQPDALACIQQHY